jgi:hypothetical protein
VLLDDNCNGIAQITQALKGRFNLSSLHIIAHGEVGKLWLGNGFINSNTLEQYSDHLLSWGTALAPDADILLYGCNVAAGQTGQQFVQLLSQLTGADVAASSNLTGSATLGGDWELDMMIGLVEAPIAFEAETVEAYSAVLTTRRVSVATDGTQGYDDSSSPSISADGRYVAFDSEATNLVSGDTNGTGDIFVYDTVANTTRRVSVASDGTQGNSNSSSSSISADGRYVTFYSNASNLVSGDINNAPDIFVYDTVTNTTRRVSVDSNGTQGNAYSYFPSISADGSYVAFYSNANNLVSGDTNGYGDIFVSNNPLASNISSPDFNSDGKADILWRNQATGQNVVWLMDGTNLTTVVDLTSLKYPNEPPNWSIGGTGDFNGDGKEDILWRNSATGDNMMWLMDGTNMAQVRNLTPVADAFWDISSTGDFNSDGKEDILWRNSATGQNVVWLMDGTNLTTVVELTPVADPNWSIGGTGDFNGNGTEDILWRNEATGQNVVWLMDGTLLSTGVELTPVADTNWSIGGTGDYNNDGQVDILWRNGATGQNVAWLMNGTQLATGVALTPVADSNWQIAA